jgi:hypothetical protein
MLVVTSWLIMADILRFNLTASAHVGIAVEIAESGGLSKRSFNAIGSVNTL